MYELISRRGFLGRGMRLTKISGNTCSINEPFFI
jgi:hypothetical protein